MLKTNEKTKFIDSLKDNRKVWIEGDVVKDLSEHVAFKGTLETIQNLFNQLDDEKIQQQIGFRSPKTGEYVHNAFLVPKSKEELLARKEAFTRWATETLGNMSRLAESGRSYLTGWYASREYFRQYDEKFPEKITRIFEKARDENRLVISVVADPQVDRSKLQIEQEDPDLLLHVVKETEEGIIVRGAKVLATAAPYAHDIIVQTSFKFNEDQEKYANLLIVEANSPGLHMICRDTAASTNKVQFPLSSQYEEMDATVVFDDVLVPWDRVLLYKNPEGAYKALIHKRDNSLANHQSVIRLLARLEFVAGLSFLITEAIGVNDYLNVQEKLGELVIQIETIKAFLSAAEAEAKYDEFGTLWPEPLKLRIAIDLGAKYYPRAIEILQQVAGGGFLQLPSVGLEQNEEIKAFIDKYYRGANTSSENKIVLFRLAWDLVGNPLGARYELYERFFSGDPTRNYATRYKEYERTPLTNRVTDFIQKLKVDA
ncbi:4-hydroxyphenylacetate 3-hydroxylase family protein [Ureibacillus sp. NPDC094379]